MPCADLLPLLRQIVGPSHVLADGDLIAYEQDWRRRARGRALAVVRPHTTQETAAVVRACAAQGVALVPQGGNTGLVLGGIPDNSGTQIVLNMTRMNAVRSVDARNLTLTAEAGVLLQQVQQAAHDAGLMFPLSLASEGSCTIGGNLATNAGGTQVVRWGNARDLCLGLEVVTPQGAVWHGLSGLRKDNSGYDLRHLMIGSEGTLGVITAATLRLAPQPAARGTALIAVPSLEDAVALLALAHRTLGAGLAGFEVMGRFALQLVAKHLPKLRIPFIEQASAAWSVLLEYGDGESEQHAQTRLETLLHTALESGCATDAVVAENLARSHMLWHIREAIPLAQAEEGLNVKHDISVPISRIPAFVVHTDALLQKILPGVRLVVFGHLGDGNLHYNVQAPEGVDPAFFLERHETHLNTLVHDAVAHFGGSISAEHGIGALKAHMLPRYASPAALKMMRAIKQALDPQGLMNPGKVLLIAP